MTQDIYDVAILGAGAAGLFCASELPNKNLKAIIFEGNKAVGKKILISGGGRCNFTNKNHTTENLHGTNPHFAKSSDAKYGPWDFIQQVEAHKIEYFEKTLGQLFCEKSAKQIVQMLQAGINDKNIEIKTSAKVQHVSNENNIYTITTNFGVTKSRAVVVATGGLSLASLGATKIGHKIAESFGHEVTEMAAALVPFTLDQNKEKLDALSGVSFPVLAKAQRGPEFSESLLFTHKGLSGPVILQVSSFWRAHEAITINLCPKIDIGDYLTKAKHQTPKKQVGTILNQFFPKSFLDVWPSRQGLKIQTKLGDLTQKEIQKWHQNLHHWNITPSGTEGMRKAEVTRGGVSTQDISSQTMESKLSAGLYFIGEVLDVTGHLGGHNFQWAWASAYACARALEKKL